MLLTSEIHSVFVVPIIGGHPWNWGSMYRESVRSPPFVLLSAAKSYTINGLKALMLSDVLYDIPVDENLIIITEPKLTPKKGRLYNLNIY